MYTEVEKDHVLTLFESEWTVAEIIEEVGMSKATVYRILKEVGARNENETFETHNSSSQNSPSLPPNEDELTDVAQLGRKTADQPPSNPATPSQTTVSSKSQNRLNNEELAQTATSEPPFGNAAHVDSEVEKLRLRLEHEREMEKLRQQGRAQELEEMRLSNETYELKLQEERLRQQNNAHQRTLAKQALQQHQVTKRLLSKTKQEIQALLEESQQSDYSTSDLKKLHESFTDLKEQIEEVEEERGEEIYDGLVWGVLEIILATVEKALKQRSNSFLLSLSSLKWTEDEAELLEKAVSAYGFDQPVPTQKPR
jgi:AraC-like DNA-binding protein